METEIETGRENQRQREKVNELVQGIPVEGLQHIRPAPVHLAPVVILRLKGHQVLVKLTRNPFMLEGGR